MRGRTWCYIVPIASSSGVAWEVLKAFLRGHIIQYVFFRKKESITKLHSLEQQTEIVKYNFKKDKLDNKLEQTDQTEIWKTEILPQKEEFTLFWTTQKFFEEGHKAGRFLARHVKLRGAMSTISAIRYGDGSLTSEPENINVTFSDLWICKVQSYSKSPSECQFSCPVSLKRNVEESG